MSIYLENFYWFKDLWHFWKIASDQKLSIFAPKHRKVIYYQLSFVYIVGRLFYDMINIFMLDVFYGVVKMQMC